jgi:hypothetical protein
VCSVPIRAAVIKQNGMRPWRAGSELPCDEGASTGLLDDLRRQLITIRQRVDLNPSLGDVGDLTLPGSRLMDSDQGARPAKEVG